MYPDCQAQSNTTASDWEGVQNDYAEWQDLLQEMQSVISKHTQKQDMEWALRSWQDSS